MKPRNSQSIHDLLLDCVKNHSPKYVVIDEVHKRKEMEVCETIVTRGVKMIASVHGDFSQIIQNHELNGALGKPTQMTMSDKHMVKGRKTQTERLSNPIFDVIINIIKPEDNNYEYIFFDDIANCVDALISGGKAQGVSRYISESKVLEKSVFV